MTSLLMVASEWNPASGGISAFNQSLCVAAARAGASVTCLVPRFSDQEHAEALAKQVTLVAPKPSPGVTGISLLPRGLPYAASFDAIIGHGRITGGEANLLRDKYPNAKYVHFLHMDAKAIEYEKPTKDGAQPSTKLRERTGVEIELAETADLVYAVGPQLTRSFRSYLVTSGRDVTEFRPGLLDCVVAAKPFDGMECLLFGRVEDYELKGVDFAAKALGLLARERAIDFDVLRFIVRGARPNEATDLRNKILKEAPGLSVIVEEFVPDREEMSRAILGASLVLMPSKTEGFGLAGLEAISHGIPVLLTRKSGLAEAIVETVPQLADEHVVRLHLEDGLVTFAQRIAAKLLNPVASFQRAAELRKAMEPHFSWSRSVEELLQRLGGGGPPTSESTASSSSSGESDDGPAGRTSRDSDTAIAALARPQTSNPLLSLVSDLRRTSLALASWPQTLVTDRWLDRPQIEDLRRGLLETEAKSYWLLGPPGSGKSAFLSRLIEILHAADVPVLSIKADLLAPEVGDTVTLEEALELPMPAENVVEGLAHVQRVVVIVDQFDALSDIVDLKTRRMVAILQLLRKLHWVANVSVVASCREFDFARDIRFRELRYQEIRLNPLEAKQVEVALLDAGVEKEAISEHLFDLLRAPHWLNVLLRLLKSGSTTVFASQHALLEELWASATRVAGSGSEATLTSTATWMSRRETLWMPATALVGSAEQIAHLEREGFLRRDPSHLRVAFAHQTLFDFARARAFLASEDLAAYVRDGKYSLFVRPVVWSTLGYLRAAASDRYRSELEGLLGDPNLRRHLRTLLLHFLGQVDEPNEFEQRLLNSALDQASTHVVAIGAVAGRRQWFKKLQNRLAGYMITAPSSAAALLNGVIATEHDAVFEMVGHYWLPRPEHHDRVAWLLRTTKLWGEREGAQARHLLVAGHLPKHSVEMLLLTATKLVPVAAPELYLIEFERILREAMAKMVIEPPPPEDADDVERIRWEVRREPRQSLQGVVHAVAHLPEVRGLAKAQPAAFLAAVWPWFMSIVDQLSEHGAPSGLFFRRAYAYELDPWAHDHYLFGGVIGTAVARLAQNDADAWRRFVVEKQTSDVDWVHQCILRGFEAGLPDLADELAAYLVADPRRLTIGDDIGGDSVRTLAKVAPHLTDHRRSQLAAIVNEARIADQADVEASPESRRGRLELNHRHRERLAKALASPNGELPEGEADTRDSGELAQVIGSHVTVDQMSRMRNAHIMRLFEGLVDDTGFTHPKRFMSGGSVQASRVLGDVVRQHPDRMDRYAALAKQFKPLVAERPASAIFEALLESGYGLRRGGSLLEELQRLGFQSPHFRWVAAYAMEKAASKNEGAEASSLTVLSSWLHDAEELEDVPSADRDATRPIIWGWGEGGSLPSGNFPTLLALTRLFLERPEPDPDALVRILLEHLDRAESPRVWAAMVPRLAALAVAGDRGANVLAKLFEKFPQVRDSVVGARLIARSALWVVDDMLRGWVESIGASNWTLGRRAAGEMVGLLATEKSPRPWIVAAFDRYLSFADRSDERLGILTSAAYLWSNPDRRRGANAILVRACSIASTSGERDAIMRTLDVSREHVWDEHTRSFLKALADHPSVLAGEARLFGERMEQLLLEDADLVSGLVLEFVKIHVRSGETKAASFFDTGATFANMAVTLHRMEQPMRERGLDLLELLLEAESFGARDVIGEVDRRLEFESVWQ